MNPDAAHRSEKALAMLREHAASLDPDSFVSEVIRVLEGEDEAPTAAYCPACGGYLPTDRPPTWPHPCSCAPVAASIRGEE